MNFNYQCAMSHSIQTIGTRYGSGLGADLEDLQVAIDHSGSQEAAQYFEALLEYLEAEQPKPPVIKPLLQAITQAAPAVASAADTIAKIHSAFS